MSYSTQNTDEASTDITTIKRLATITLALALAISALVIGSGAAAAHAGPTDVEDHGYGPSHPLSDDGMSDRERAPAEDAGSFDFRLDSESPTGDSYGGVYNG